MSSSSSSVLMTPEVLDETVTLYVGDKRKKHIVHKKILCDQSQFFNSEFKKVSKGEMYLPEDNPAVVVDLIEFLYRGKLPKITQKGKMSPEVNDQCIKLYLLAEKFCMSVLMNRLIDHIIQGFARIEFSSAQLEWIYRDTDSTSKLRSFAAASTAFGMGYLGESKDWVDSRSSLLRTFPDLSADLFQILCRHGKKLFTPRHDFAVVFTPCYFHNYGPEADFEKSEDTLKAKLDKTAKSAIPADGDISDDEKEMKSFRRRQRR